MSGRTWGDPEPPHPQSAPCCTTQPSDAIRGAPPEGAPLCGMTTYPSMQRCPPSGGPDAGLHLPACSAAAPGSRGVGVARCTLGAVVRPHVGHARCLPPTAAGLTPPPRSALLPAPSGVPPQTEAEEGRGSRGGWSGAMGDSKVKVAVRVRPMNRRGETLLPQLPLPGAGGGCEGSGPEGQSGAGGRGCRSHRCL